MPLTNNHDGVSTLIHTVHIDPNMKMWCAGDRLCGAIARNEHEHTTVEQMPTIAAMRVSIFTIIIIYSRFYPWICFLLSSLFGWEIASRSHNLKHQLGVPKDFWIFADDCWRFLFILIFVCCFFPLFNYNFKYNIPSPSWERSTGPFDKAAVHTSGTKISTKRHIRQETVRGHFSRRVTVLSLVKKQK